MSVDMWKLLRPDAARVWNDPETIRRLSRYRDIIDQRRWAKYLLAKDIPCEPPLDSSSILQLKTFGTPIQSFMMSLRII